MNSYENYLPDNVKPFEFADPQQEADVLREAVEQRLGRAASGQHFSAIHVNRTFTESPVIVRLNSLFGSTANADQQYIASQFAAAFPENAYLSIDLPAHGSSDKLTSEQRKAITKSDGSLGSVAEAQIEAAQSLIPNLNEAILTGEAVGELFAVEFAAQAALKGIKVRQLFGFDPFGMEDRSPIAAASSYLAQAQRSRNNRRKEPTSTGEKTLEHAFSKIFISKIEPLGPTRSATRIGHTGLLAKERTILRLMFRKSPLTRDTGVRALETALETQSQLTARLVFAGLSTVGRLTPRVAESLTNLQFESGGRVMFEEWPSDNQDLGLAKNHPRLIAYIQDNLEI